jgi:hypothetical protein
MDTLTIQISWQWALGIVGTLITITWIASRWVGTIKTDISWLKDGVKDLRSEIENKTVGAFGASSPISLTPKGKELLDQSGIKEFIDNRKQELLLLGNTKELKSAYDVQEFVFGYFDAVQLDEKTDEKIKKYAFNEGISTDIIRRVGAIYFRNLLLEKCGFKPEDLDVQTKQKQ